MELRLFLFGILVSATACGGSVVAPAEPDGGGDAAAPRNDGAPPSADAAVSTHPHAPDGGADNSSGTDASARDASASACTAAGGTCAPAGTCPATIGLEDACGDPAVSTCCIGADDFPDASDDDARNDVDCVAANGVCQPAGGICTHEIHTSSCGDPDIWTCCAK